MTAVTFTLVLTLIGGTYAPSSMVAVTGFTSMRACMEGGDAWLTAMRNQLSARPHAACVRVE
jgi:hypothetical protein